MSRIIQVGRKKNRRNSLNSSLSLRLPFNPKAAVNQRRLQNKMLVKLNSQNRKRVLPKNKQTHKQTQSPKKALKTHNLKPPPNRTYHLRTLANRKRNRKILKKKMILIYPNRKILINQNWMTLASPNRKTLASPNRKTRTSPNRTILRRKAPNQRLNWKKKTNPLKLTWLQNPWSSHPSMKRNMCNCKTTMRSKRVKMTLKQCSFSMIPVSYKVTIVLFFWKRQWTSNSLILPAN